jgi:hypothetical protein
MMLLFAGVCIGAVIGYVGRILDQQQARRNGWKL